MEIISDLAYEGNLKKEKEKGGLFFENKFTESAVRNQTDSVTLQPVGACLLYFGKLAFLDWVA